MLRPQLGDLAPSARSALVPIAFPLLFTPQLAVLAILFGATESFAPAWGWLAVGVGAGVAVGALRYRRPELWLAVARLFAALLVLLGIALVIAGIRDV
jgi:small neutral amino acid transporter SnatA (MarC family)